MSGLRNAVRKALNPLAEMLGRAGVHPNTLTYLGLLFSLLAGVSLAAGRLAIAVIPLALSGLADMLDGAVARATGRASPYGAALDSTVDRIAEAFVLGGLLIAEARRGAGGPWLAVLILIFLIASFLVSYTRARAEGLGFSGQVGFMERPARMVGLMVLLLLGRGALPAGLGILSVLTIWTVLQRLGHIRRQSRAVVVSEAAGPVDAARTDRDAAS